jgi:hypothetical protein
MSGVLEMIRWATVFCAVSLLACTGTPDRTGSSGIGLADPAVGWDDAVIEEVLRMAAADQAVRAQLVEMQQAKPGDFGPDFARAVAEQDSVDRANTGRLKEILGERGWPRVDKVGTEATRAAFLIVQHADHDLTLQQEYLSFLKAEYEEGRGSGGHVALLTDRTRLAEGLGQLYGTQLNIEDGRLVLKPIDDESRVDERRAALGLPPLSEYLQRVKAAYGLDH